MKVTCGHPDRQHKAKGLCASCHRRSLERPLVSANHDPVAKAEAREEIITDKRQIAKLVEQLREAKTRTAFLDATQKYAPTPRISARETLSGIREMTAVACASDWHVEEEVDPISVAYRNAYNLEIASDRIERFFDGIIWNVLHHRASKKVVIRDLVLWLGGDLISGYIHEDLVESNALSPTETVRWLMPRLRNGILRLLKVLDLEHIEIPCSHGNHGRTTMRSRIQTGAENSYENLMYHMLAEIFRDEDRVHFEITASPHQYVEVYDYTLHFHHGDSIKYGGGIGGLAVPLLKAIPAWDQIKRADFHIIGHYHQLADYGRGLVNGSLIGFGAYSQWIKASPEPPQQLFFLVDKHRAKCMSTALWVGESEQKVAM